MNLGWHHCPPLYAFASTALAGRAYRRVSSHCRPSLCETHRHRQRTQRFQRARKYFGLMHLVDERRSDLGSSSLPLTVRTLRVGGRDRERFGSGFSRHHQPSPSASAAAAAAAATLTTGAPVAPSAPAAAVFLLFDIIVFESGTIGSRTNQAASFLTPSATA